MSKPKSIGHKEVGAFLEDRARNLGGRAPLTYNEIIMHFGMPPLTGAWPAHPLSKIFDELDIEDAKRNLPFRTALAINEKSNMPGQGFFKTYARLCPWKRQPRSEQEKMKFHVNEVNLVLKHFGGKSLRLKGVIKGRS